MLAPLARVIGPQARAWLPSAPLIAQPAPPLCEATTQWTKGLGPPGRLSLMAAPVAASGRAWARVILTGVWRSEVRSAALWTFVRVRLEQLTSSEAEAGPLPSLVVVRSEERRVGKECRSAGSAVTWTTMLAPLGRVIGPQARAWRPGSPLTATPSSAVCGLT